MKIKNIVLIILSVCLITSFTGCAKKANNSQKDTALKVGVDLKFYPFMYLDDDGNPTGFEVDIAHAFGEYLGQEVEIVNTDFSMLIPALDTGAIDIIVSNMLSNPERKLKASFTKPYRYGRTLALVNKDFASKNNITDEMRPEEFFNIQGIKFAGLTSTIGVSVPQSYGADVIELTEIASALMEVSSGKVDALIGSTTVYGDHEANKDTTTVYSNIPSNSGSSFAVKKGNDELLNKANAFIDSMYEDGGFYQQAGTKYDELICEYMHKEDLGLSYIIYPKE